MGTESRLLVCCWAAIKARQPLLWIYILNKLVTWFQYCCVANASPCKRKVKVICMVTLISWLQENGWKIPLKFQGTKPIITTEWNIFFFWVVIRRTAAAVAAHSFMRHIVAKLVTLSGNCKYQLSAVSLSIHNLCVPSVFERNKIIGIQLCVTNTSDQMTCFVDFLLLFIWWA